MRVFLFSLVGAVLFGAVCVAITWVIGATFGPLYYGEEEANRNFGYFLVAFSMSVVIGIYVGFRLSRKSN